MDKIKRGALFLPGILLMGILVLYPIIKTFYLSLLNYKLTRPNQTKFIGLENYIKVIQSQDFMNALINTLYILVIVTVVVLIISIAIGMLLNINSSMSSFLTACAIIPWALPPLVNGIIWRFMFHPTYGLINKLLLNFGLIETPIFWLTDRWQLLMIVSFVIAWRVIPFCAIIVLERLQAIPFDLYEAAQVDGANRWYQMTDITLPFIAPAIKVVLLQALLAGVMAFDEIIALAGYRFETQSLLVYNYMNTFSYLDFGYGSAITYISMLLSGVFGYFYIRSINIENAVD